MIRRIVSATLAAVLAAGCIAAYAEGLSGGDVTGDGSINVSDVVKLSAQVKGVKWLNADEKARADVNGDGLINVSDVVMLAAHVKGGENDKPEPPKTDEQLTRELAVLVNKERRQRGLSPYVYSPELTQAAMRRASEIAKVYDHFRPDGSAWYTVLPEFGITPPPINGEYAAENICYGFNTPEEAFGTFMDSDAHRASMLDPDKTYIGIGVARDNEGGYYWVQLFANGNGLSGYEV